jgi:hypothetical protein
MEIEHIKTKRFVKSWLSCVGQLQEDHQRFSKSLIKKLAFSGVCSLGDFETERLKMRRLKSLVKKRPFVHFDEAHEIDGHGGLSLRETGISLDVLGRQCYGSSAIESLGISPLIGANVVVRSVCIVTGTDICISLSPFGYETEHDKLSLSFYHPDVLTLDVCQSCEKWSSFVLGEDAQEKYLKDNPDQILLPLSQSFQMARDIQFELYKTVIS